MGFETGDLLGDVGGVGFCADFNDNNHCGKEDQAIAVKDIACLGGEDNVMECDAKQEKN